MSVLLEGWAAEYSWGHQDILITRPDGSWFLVDNWNPTGFEAPKEFLQKLEEFWREKQSFFQISATVSIGGGDYSEVHFRKPPPSEPHRRHGYVFTLRSDRENNATPLPDFIFREAWRKLDQFILCISCGAEHQGGGYFQRGTFSEPRKLCSACWQLEKEGGS